MHGQKAACAGNALRPRFQIIQHQADRLRHGEQPWFVAARRKRFNACKPAARIR